MAADFDLSGRVAIITGGNGGIGLGMARALARAGCAISIWGRNTRKNGEALAELSGFGAPVEARACDVTDRAAVEQAFAATPPLAGSTDASPTPASGAAADRRSSIAPSTTGGACSRPISTASFMSSRSSSGI